MLCQSYPGQPTISLTVFLVDFHAGRAGRPLTRKAALNQIYKGIFPVPVLNDRILIRDIAVWLYQIRTKTR